MIWTVKSNPPSSSRKPWMEWSEFRSASPSGQAPRDHLHHVRPPAPPRDRDLVAHGLAGEHRRDRGARDHDRRGVVGEPPPPAAAGGHSDQQKTRQEGSRNSDGVHGVSQDPPREAPTNVALACFHAWQRPCRGSEQGGRPTAVTSKVKDPCLVAPLTQTGHRAGRLRIRPCRAVRRRSDLRRLLAGRAAQVVKWKYGCLTPAGAMGGQHYRGGQLRCQAPGPG